MRNMIEIDGRKAIVSYDPEIGMLRGEFVGLTGGADFYAKDTDRLAEEGTISLRVYLEGCAEKGIEPYRAFSGKFNIRLDAATHEAAVAAAAAADKSLNEWVAEAIEEAARAA
jgi:predicted HicB family RNase H-like nuclease